MRLPVVFGESFLNGFTMAGFLTRLRRPGEPTLLFAPAYEQSGQWLPVVFRPGTTQSDGVRVAGDLRGIPAHALHAMMEVLKREDEERKTSLSEKAMHGASR
ncbi:MAG TPA: hypothetical protein VFC39_17985 [Acidobacteriaceae bacterium]|nr:hypothetical protein [Acidobacteriaceae bacterium]